MVIIPAICLLIGLAVQLLPMRALQVAVIVALLEIAAASAPYYYMHAQIQDFRTPITWLQARYQAGDGIVCFPNELCSIPTQAYLRAYPSAARFDADSPGSYSWVKSMRSRSRWRARKPTRRITIAFSMSSRRWAARKATVL